MNKINKPNTAINTSLKIDIKDNTIKLIFILLLVLISSCHESINTTTTSPNSLINSDTLPSNPNKIDTVYESSSLLYIDQYVNGELIFRTKYYTNGNKVYERPFKNGKLHGSYKMYYQNENVSEIIQYVNGLFHGFYEKYNVEGVFLFRTCYMMGVEKGNWTEGQSCP